MSSFELVAEALDELRDNPEQFDAVQEGSRHCVVLAGPGSGKTKVLTVSMALALLNRVAEPRGVACITYNNECGLELETRMQRLGIEPTGRVFIGTVHGFALSQVIVPYARAAAFDLPDQFRVASLKECQESQESTYKTLFGDSGSVRERWRFAEQKRRSQVDRHELVWRSRNPELAEWVELYESDLRRRGLIDFDDMPLLAYRMMREHPWIRQSLLAKFPILFIDEYQDLGHALHELVLLMCFETGIRLFAVGDVDQTVYSWIGANPALLQNLTKRADVRVIRLRLNYRSSGDIIRASLAALGQKRIYEAADKTSTGNIRFIAVDGDLSVQATRVLQSVVPGLLKSGIPIDEIAVLYRTAKEGDVVAAAARTASLPIVRSDNGALVKRSSRVARWCEACASWVSSGWKKSEPRLSSLSHSAASFVYGTFANEDERFAISVELADFLQASIDKDVSTNMWMRRLRDELVNPWRQRRRMPDEEWDVIDQIIERTDDPDIDLPLAHFAGHTEGSGRLNLSTLHSAKAREFDAVVLFAMNVDSIPSGRDKYSPATLNEARRLFYVGVSRARHDLHIVFRKGFHSPWVKVLYDDVRASRG